MFKTTPPVDGRTPHNAPLEGDRANSGVSRPGVEELSHDDRAEWEEVLKDGLLSIEDHPVFQQYCDLFFRYFQKSPYHVKKGYEQGFVAPDPKQYKDGTGTYARRCHDKLISRHLDADPTRPYWIGLRFGAKTTLRCIDLDNKDNLLGYYRVGGAYRPVARLPLARFRAMKRLYDALPGQGHVWCVSSATLGLHVWTKLGTLRTRDQVERQTRPLLAAIGLGATEVFPSPSKANHVLRRPFGLDYHTITDSGLLSDWQEQTKHFVAATTPPAFASVVLSMLKLAAAEWERCDWNGKFKVSRQSAFASKRFLHLKALRAEADEVVAWVKAGCPDDNPAVLNSDATKSPPRRKRCSSEPLTGAWSWSSVKALARDGVPEEDKLFQYLLLLARPLIWRDYFHLDADERTRRAEEDLLYWVENKHNGLVTRVQQGDMDNVLHEVRRQVKVAGELTDPSLQDFYARMRERDKLNPSKVELLSDIIRDRQSTASSLVCCRRINKESDDAALPPAVEEVLLRVASEQRMRQRGGEYPFVRFARRLLNVLWQEDGAAHVHRDHLFMFCASKNPNQVLAYKRLMVECGLICDQWEGHVQRGASSALYQMTGPTFEQFQQHFRTSKVMKRVPMKFTPSARTDSELEEVAWSWEGSEGEVAGS
jgi:hypothetical protein